MGLGEKMVGLERKIAKFLSNPTLFLPKHIEIEVTKQGQKALFPMVFVSAIRVVNSLRVRLVRGMSLDGAVPSQFLECLVHGHGDRDIPD